jgi:ElaB/YqjD/DUF883 family membrane-anchored ribosome-binding protein
LTLIKVPGKSAAHTGNLSSNPTETVMADYADARTRLLADLQMMLADTEELLTALGTESKEKVAAARPRVEAAVARAKGRLEELEGEVEERARKLAQNADQYAHENPWQTAGVAAGFGAALGAVIGVLLARR